MAKELVQQTGFSLPSLMPGFFRKAVISRLKKVRKGCVVLQDQTGLTVCGDDTCKPVVIKVFSDRLYVNMATKGALGAAQSWIDGDWDCDQLSDLIRILVENQKALGSLEKGSARVKDLFRPLHHFRFRNHLRGSRQNIEAHYDLSDDLFKRFLDPTMMYSSAFFATESMSLEQASLAKLERICRKLNLKPQDKVLEIGSGWGGFAIYAAKHFGCHVTTTTISGHQYQYVLSRVKSEGLSDKIELKKLDYRELTGTYDKLVSIEMIEAVGAEYLDTYLSVCARLLKDDGAALIQAISINGQIYERALKEFDFIKKYIFPGSFIPSLHAISESLTRQTDFRIYNVEDMTPHYERTLQEWQKNFNENFKEISRFGFDERFRRMWNYYFSYCIGGFAGRSIGSLQILLGKPGYREDLSVRTTINEGGS